MNNINSALNYTFSMLMLNQNETNVIAIFHLRTSNLRRLGLPCAYERPRQWPHCSRALDMKVDEVSDNMRGSFLIRGGRIHIPLLADHRRSASETPFKWRFAGVPMMAKH